MGAFARGGSEACGCCWDRAGIACRCDGGGLLHEIGDGHVETGFQVLSCLCLRGTDCTGWGVYGRRMQPPYRVGTGYDIHQLVEGYTLVLGVDRSRLLWASTPVPTATCLVLPWSTP